MTALARIRRVCDRMRLNGRLVRWPMLDLLIGRALLRALDDDSTARTANDVDDTLAEAVLA